MHLQLVVFLSILCNSVQEETDSVRRQNSDSPTRTDPGVGKTPQKNERMTGEELYMRLFQQQRFAHKEAIQTILSLDTYEKQHRMIGIVLEKLFKVLSDAKITLTSAGFTPGDAFPSDNDTVRDALSNIAENTAFFGDLVLRLPDITHNLFDRKKEWNVLLGWSIGFCNSTGLFKENDTKLLHLMAQEVNFVKRDPDYVNPYSQKYAKQMRERREMKESESKKQTKRKKKKKENKKGPKLSKVEL